MVKKIIACIAILLTGINSSFSQTDQDDLDAIFDDGNISTAKNIVKVNPTALIAGDIPIYYERLISDVLTLEVGLGYLMNIKAYEVTLPVEDLAQEAKGSGLSIWVNPRFFLAGDAPEGGYLGLLYRKRQYSSGIVYSDFCFTSGFQFNLDKRIMLDVMYGTGIRVINDPDQQQGLNRSINSKVVFPVALKFGYLF